MKYYVKAWIGWLCIYWVVHGPKLMNFVWPFVWNMIGWLIKYLYEIGMHDEAMLVGKTWLWYGLGRNSMNLVVRVHGGASSNGRNSINLVVKVHGGASSNGRNSMNLVVRIHGGASSNGWNSMDHSVRFHGGASRLGHNSMTFLVGAHGGAS